MNRQIVWPGAIPLETDLLYTNRHMMVGLGRLIMDILGASTLASGLACSPTTPASMSVGIGAGALYALDNIDNTAYSSLPANTTDQIMKQGILLGSANKQLTMTAPTTAGQSVIYLIQAAFSEVDGGSTVLPYYNPSNPAVAYSGPGNSGAPSFTMRQDTVNVNAKAGVAASSPAPPSADTGFVPLYYVTIAFGATTITAGNISVAPGAPFIPATLTNFMPKSGGTFSGNVFAPRFIASADNGGLISAGQPAGAGAEGGQIVLGYPGNTVVTTAGGSTWNIDVDSLGMLRTFQIRGNGVGRFISSISEATGVTNYLIAPTINGSAIWTAASLTNLSQLANDPGYMMSSGATMSGNLMGQYGFFAQGLDAATITANGFGIRSRGDGSGNPAIIQFTNSAANAQWGRIQVTSGGVMNWTGTIASAGMVTASGGAGGASIQPGSSAPGSLSLFDASGTQRGLVSATNGGQMTYAAANGGHLFSGGNAVFTGGSVAALSGLFVDALFGLQIGGFPTLLLDAGDYFGFDRTNNKFVWAVGNTIIMSLDMSGNLRLAGSLIQNTTP